MKAEAAIAVLCFAMEKLCSFPMEFLYPFAVEFLYSFAVEILCFFPVESESKDRLFKPVCYPFRGISVLFFCGIIVLLSVE
jgi:hypothetical protein